MILPSSAFAFDDFRGEIENRYRPADLEAEVRRLTDPVTATETIHWGRNYLYRTWLETPEGRRDVVVKQFRNQGLAGRLNRRLRGSKAERSWRSAQAFVGAGIDTAPPVALVESTKPDGPSFFVTLHLPGMLEARFLFRAANDGRERSDFPDVDFPAFLERLGRLLRRMHDAGLFHRDLSIGNVLLDRAEPERLVIIDLNRARQRRWVGFSARLRDLCRLAIFRREHQDLFLRAYYGGEPGAWRAALYRLYHHGFLFKIAAKKRWRSVLGDLLKPFRPRRAHVHMPAAPEGASARDKIVWDALSDQPHQHASRFEKLRVRAADAPRHLRQAAACLAALPAVRRRYRALRAGLYAEPVPWEGAGIALRPWPAAPDELLSAVDELGLRHVLLRLHPWADDDRHELELARALHERGLELAFALPQNRDLVRDPVRWRARVEELAERFSPFGRHFQVGQAINRSKWGIWTLGEYFELAHAAAEILRRRPGVEVVGPAVIDFEVYATLAALHLKGSPRFDALASLLYVDRRGAPENTQLGFDTTGKVLLMQAIAETAPRCAPRSWITEVNWPLWEGPHSPAGRSVSVDEATQADYLARYFLLALTTGRAERVYWWQLVARGYGLAAPAGDGGLRRRPSFQALATLERELRGATFVGPLDAPAGAHLFRFRRGDGDETGDEVVAGWSRGEPLAAVLPRPAASVVGRDGEALPAGGAEVVVTSSVRYFRLAAA